MEEIIFPVYYPCINEADFLQLDLEACNLLAIPNTTATDYQQPLIDVYENYWFIVNVEVQSLVDLSKCVPFEDIVLPTPEPIG
jgi:hypothetical protein